MINDSYTPEQVSAFWTAIGALATVVTGVVAIVTLLALRRDSRDRSRPVIAVDLVPVVLGLGESELVVENVGVGIARDVSVSFDPPIEESMGDLAAYLQRRYSRTIPTMTPGRRLANIYAIARGDGSRELSDPVPAHLSVTVTYTDTHGHHYADSFQLTTDTLFDETSSSPSSSGDEAMRKRLTKAVESIAKGLGR
jgi:hypothetical protein